MSDYNENQSLLMTRMDDAFCAAMRMAIAAGLESAPIGVITTPGTKTPKYASRASAASLPVRQYELLVDADQCADLQSAILCCSGEALPWCCIPCGTAAKRMQGLEEFQLDVVFSPKGSR
jgi:hypothetical protein